MVDVVRHRTAGCAVALALAGLVGVPGGATRAAPPTSRRPGAPVTQADAAQKDTLADAYLRLCRNCHEAARLQLDRRTRLGWQDIIDQMLEKGATGSDEDFGLVLQYLLRDYGKVNVNLAPAADLALVLGLSTKEADAVVAHREKNGRFKDFDALLKVAGVDLKPLEAHRAAVVF